MPTNRLSGAPIPRKETRKPSTPLLLIRRQVYAEMTNGRNDHPRGNGPRFVSINHPPRSILPTPSTKCFYLTNLARPTRRSGHPLRRFSFTSSRHVKIVLALGGEDLPTMAVRLAKGCYLLDGVLSS